MLHLQHFIVLWCSFMTEDITFLDGVYTVAEVAGLLKVTPKTVTRWIASGEVSAYRLPSGMLRIPKSEVEQLLSPAGEGAR